jgi:hypothetical protein
MWVGNIKMDLIEIEWCGMDWFALAQDTENWRTGFHKMLGNYRIATQLAGSQVVLSSIELAISVVYVISNMVYSAHPCRAAPLLMLVVGVHMLLC